MLSRPLLLVLVVSFAAKAALRLALAGPGYWDTGYTHYFLIARNYLHTGSLFLGDPSSPVRYWAFRPPIYPLFIAGVYQATNGSIAAFVVAEAIVSTLSVWLVHHATQRLAGPRAALLAAALYAFFPYAFFHDTQLQETVLYVFLSLAAFVLVLRAVERDSRPLFFLAGLVAGLAILTRVSHSAVVLFTSLGLFFFARRARRAIPWLVVGTVVTLAPWVIRNGRITGRYVLTSETGFALARAHNEQTFRYFPYRANIDESWSAWHETFNEDERRAIAGDELSAGAWYRGKALAYMRQHPWRTLGEGFYKVGVSFAGILSPLHEPWRNALYSGSYYALMLLALLGFPRVRATPYAWLGGATIVAHSATTFVFWAHTSHRAFLDPLFAVPAGIGLASLDAARRRAYNQSRSDDPNPQNRRRHPWLPVRAARALRAFCEASLGAASGLFRP